ncbi:MAG TPA: cytochrome P450 [Microthrixaceae bacterium]|nr:cytochrome P450 [Microthrixaceae bacterium]HNI34682.1 cytochrome P450 [Microthrixaceae bacterium]
MDIADIDLLDPDRFQQQLHHEMFEVLRQQDPLHWTEEPDGPGFWSITKHADLQLVNRDAEGFSSEAKGVNIQEIDTERNGAFDMRGQMMLMTDPPKHTRYRLLVNKGFTPRMIGLIEEHLRYRAELIVDSIIERGECDFVLDVAAELPLQAIAEIMGVPEADRHMIFDWTNRMIGADDPEYGDADSHLDAQTAAAELYGYAAKLRVDRAEVPLDDIVTKLINAEINGDRLTDAEFEMFILLLAVAGNETTRNATAHGMHALMTNPDQYAKLVADPSLITSAIEEIVRWATPVMYFRRQAMRDLELRGKQIKAGDKVVMWHISANRDEEVFADPFRFDIERSPNDHVGFGGGGAHFCLGANLARSELRLIFHELVTRIPDMALAGDPQRLRSNFIGGIKHMPVTFTPGLRKHPVGSHA